MGLSAHPGSCHCRRSWKPRRRQLTARQMRTCYCWQRRRRRRCLKCLLAPLHSKHLVTLCPAFKFKANDATHRSYASTMQYLGAWALVNMHLPGLDICLYMFCFEGSVKPDNGLPALLPATEDLALSACGCSAGAAAAAPNCAASSGSVSSGACSAGAASAAGTAALAGSEVDGRAGSAAALSGCAALAASAAGSGACMWVSITTESCLSNLWLGQVSSMGYMVSPWQLPHLSRKLRSIGWWAGMWPTGLKKKLQGRARSPSMQRPALGETAPQRGCPKRQQQASARCLQRGCCQRWQVPFLLP